MDDTDLPEPESWGSLEPPRRRPPTAIGVLTPPPPRRPDADHTDGGFLLQRIARYVARMIGLAFRRRPRIFAVAGRSDVRRKVA